MPSTQIISNSNPQSNGNCGNENSNGNNEMPNMLNMVEMEQDLLNDHECMAPMMQLIKFMSNKKIYSSSDSQLPLWMNEIKVKIEDNDVHSNVKLFLLRLILNCHAEFEPFAKHFTSVILKTISSEDPHPPHTLPPKSINSTKTVLNLFQTASSNAPT